MAFLPSISGLSWFGVLVISSLPPLSTSQAQPLPKRPMPAALNCSLNASKLPNAALMASAPRPSARRRRWGAISFQNSEWFQWPPPLLRTAVRMSSGTPPGRERSSRLFVVQLGVLLERGVQVGHVRLVMLAVMNLHRLRVDVRFERGEVVRQGWQWCAMERPPQAKMG
jgi:hypothetical protein